MTRLGLYACDAQDMLASASLNRGHPVGETTKPELHTVPRKGKQTHGKGGAPTAERRRPKIFIPADLVDGRSQSSPGASVLSSGVKDRDGVVLYFLVVCVIFLSCAQ